MEILILSIKKDDDNLFIIEKENGDINFLSKTPESNIERGKKYFTIDKSKITLNGYFYNTYEIFHYDGPNHPSGTEYGYIFLKNGKKNIIRDDYLKMKFHEDKISRLSNTEEIKMREQRIKELQRMQSKIQDWLKAHGEQASLELTLSVG